MQPTPGTDREQAAQARALARYRLWLLHLGVAYRQLSAADTLDETFRTLQQAQDQRSLALQQTALRLSADTPAIRQQLETLGTNSGTDAAGCLLRGKKPAHTPAVDHEQVKRILQHIRTDIQTLDQQLRRDFPAYTQLTSTQPSPWRKSGSGSKRMRHCCCGC
ncbi:MAG: hypothetical protein R3E95_09145 [Thiolinea sp.]